MELFRLDLPPKLTWIQVRPTAIMSLSFINRFITSFNLAPASLDHATHPKGRQAAGPAGAVPATVERPPAHVKKQSTVQVRLIKALNELVDDSHLNKLKKRRRDAGRPAARSATGKVEENPRLTRKSYRQFKRTLDRWAKEETGNKDVDKARQRAARRIKGWCYMRLKNALWESPLRLSGLGLCEIPPLPAGVQTVDLSRNLMTRLSSLDKLPNSLVSLDLAGNALKFLDESDLGSINPAMRVRLGSTQLTPETKQLIRQVAPNLLFDAPAFGSSQPTSPVAPRNASASPGKFSTVQEALMHWVQSADDGRVEARFAVYQDFMRENARRSGQSAVLRRQGTTASNLSAMPASENLQKRIEVWRSGVNAAQVAARTENVESVMDGQSQQGGPARQGHRDGRSNGSSPSGKAFTASKSIPGVRSADSSTSSSPPRRAHSSSSAASQGETPLRDVAGHIASPNRPVVPPSASGSDFESPVPKASSVKPTAKGIPSFANSGGVRPLPKTPRLAAAAASQDVVIKTDPVELQDWINRGETSGGNRQEAVSRIMEWRKDSTGPGDDRPLDLSNLDLDEIPPWLPENLMTLRLGNNRIDQVQLLSQLPKSLQTLNLDGNYITKLPDDCLNPQRENLIITVDGALLSEDDKQALVDANLENKGPIYVLRNPEQVNRKPKLDEWLKYGPADEMPARLEAYSKIKAWEKAAAKASEGNVPPLDLSAHENLKFSSMPPIPNNVSELHVHNQGVKSITIRDLPENLKTITLEGNPLINIHDRGLPASYKELIVNIGETSTLPLSLMRDLNYRQDNPGYFMSPAPSNDGKKRCGEYDNRWISVMPFCKKYIGGGEGEERVRRTEAIRRLEVWFHQDNGETRETALNLSGLGLTQLPSVWPERSYLNYINARGNRLEEIPFTTLPPELYAIDLRDNLISSLPVLTNEQMKSVDGLVVLLTDNPVCENEAAKHEISLDKGPEYILDDNALQEYRKERDTPSAAKFFEQRRAVSSTFDASESRH